MTDAEHGVAPAGWYPNGEVLRYWDGKAWTEHTAPLERQVPPADKRAEKQAARAQAAAAKASDPLRPDIQAAMSKMSYKVGSKREVKRLADHLWHDEHVSLITGGTYGPGTGIVVLTDRRLFFLKDGLMSKTSEDFPLANLSDCAGCLTRQ